MRENIFRRFDRLDNRAVLVGRAVSRKRFGRCRSPDRKRDFRRVRKIARSYGDLKTRRSRFVGGNRKTNFRAVIGFYQNTLAFFARQFGVGRANGDVDRHFLIGLILNDDYSPPENLDALCQRFSEALSEFGYPECPGHIMVTNVQWRKSASEFGQMTRQWLILPDAESLMNLAIFMDAHSVCGNARLLQEVQRRLMTLAIDSDAMLSRFAAAIDFFGSSTGWWNRLLGLGDIAQQLNLKKEGIFPLVHGVRSLALACLIPQTSTTGRITALVTNGHLEPDMGVDLADSLHFFMGLKLKVGLAEIDRGKPVTGAIDVAHLSSLDRDLLKDTLGVVKRFKALLRHRFHLEAM